MNVPLRVLGLLCPILLAECVTAGGGDSHLSITRAGSTAADLDSDNTKCRYEIALAQQGRPRSGDWIADGVAGGIAANELRYQCLQAKGWAIKRVGL
jgi:hypothetical protein